MANFVLLWETEEEREVVQAVMLDWYLYGEIHITNAKGLTRLHPAGITYTPPAPQTTADAVGVLDGVVTERN